MRKKFSIVGYEKKVIINNYDIIVDDNDQLRFCNSKNDNRIRFYNGSKSILLCLNCQTVTDNGLICENKEEGCNSMNFDQITLSNKDSLLKDLKDNDSITSSLITTVTKKDNNYLVQMKAPYISGPSIYDITIDTMNIFEFSIDKDFNIIYDFESMEEAFSKKSIYISDILDLFSKLDFITKDELSAFTTLLMKESDIYNRIEKYIEIFKSIDNPSLIASWEEYDLLYIFLKEEDQSLTFEEFLDKYNIKKSEARFIIVEMTTYLHPVNYQRYIYFILYVNNKGHLNTFMRYRRRAFYNDLFTEFIWNKISAILETLYSKEDQSISFTDFVYDYYLEAFLAQKNLNKYQSGRAIDPNNPYSNPSLNYNIQKVKDEKVIVDNIIKKLDLKNYNAQLVEMLLKKDPLFFFYLTYHTKDFLTISNNNKNIIENLLMGGNKQNDVEFKASKSLIKHFQANMATISESYNEFLDDFPTLPNYNLLDILVDMDINNSESVIIVGALLQLEKIIILDNYVEDNYGIYSYSNPDSYLEAEFARYLKMIFESYKYIQETKVIKDNLSLYEYISLLIKDSLFSQRPYYDNLKISMTTELSFSQIDKTYGYIYNLASLGLKYYLNKKNISNLLSVTSSIDILKDTNNQDVAKEFNINESKLYEFKDIKEVIYILLDYNYFILSDVKNIFILEENNVLDLYVVNTSKNIIKIEKDS